jgi:photosystem II stability/assembly factor-like uncharacterized protein
MPMMARRVSVPRGGNLGVVALALVGAGLGAQAPTRTPVAPATRPAPAAPATFDARDWTGLRWRTIGPARGGRVTAVAGHPDQPLTFYFGSTGGGVWRTTNAGATWVPLTDGQLPVGSIGAVTVAPIDTTMIWVGTGSDGIRSNVSIGKGVYVSTDGGRRWQARGLATVGQIGTIAVHPRDARTAWVAAIGNPFAPTPDRGIYKTTDGGATWRKTLFVSDSTGAVDVVLAPDDPRTVYAAMWRAQRTPYTVISGAREGGLYKSTDGGETWAKLTTGLPAGLFGKSDLSVSAADPARVYALIEAPGDERGLYRSDDRGATWRIVNRTFDLLRRPFYYTQVVADPTNADIVYVNNEGFFKSTDAGRTFARVPTPHGDNHDLWINPKQPQLMVQSNDGGANVSIDGGRTWSTQYNQPTAELYQVAVDDQFPYRLYGAQQDNSTLIVPSLPPDASAPDDPVQYWRQGPGCETGPIVPKRGDPTVVYGACKGQFSRYSLATGQERHSWVGGQHLYGANPVDLQFRFQRVAPLEVSRHDPRVIYHASQYVHRSTDEGVTWERISPDLTANLPEGRVSSGTPITRDITGEEYWPTLYALAESPHDAKVLWAGANDGPIHLTRDGGATWKNVTPPTLGPGGRVQTIEVSPHRPGTAYVAVLRYLLGDFAPYLFRTDDYGATWTRITDGIRGDEPTRVIREDPDRPGLLYAGTEFGMYVSFDRGGRWHPLQLNLPATPVTDLEVHRKDLVISTQGRGFWILDDVTPLHQVSDATTAAAAHLFAPRVAHRIRYGGAGEGGRPRDPSDPQFPPPGASLDYWVAGDGPVTIEIRDAQGALVRAFSSDAPGERDVAVQGMRAPSLERVGTPRLTAGRGVHRFTWDLAHAGPWAPTPAAAGRGGPAVRPGTYTVRLTAGGVTQERRLEVRADPRVLADGLTPADLAAQERHNLAVRDLVSAARVLAARVDSARRAATGDAKARFDAQWARLQNADGAYPEQKFLAQVQYLYSMTTRADQKVPRDAVTRLAALRRQLAEEEAAFAGRPVTASDAP